MVVYNVGSHQYVSFIDDKNINKQYKSCRWKGGTVIGISYMDGCFKGTIKQFTKYIEAEFVSIKYYSYWIKLLLKPCL